MKPWTAILAALALVVGVAWWAMIRMPGESFTGQIADLSGDETTLRDELSRHVHALAEDIGERNFIKYDALNAAAAYIEHSFAEAGLTSRRDSYEINGKIFSNIIAEIRGNAPQIVVIGAHYDSVIDAPGANDNASGVAALLALAKRFAATKPRMTLRFVAFTNEEPPHFQMRNMGSIIYANRCRARDEAIVAMMSLETIGCFSDEPGSQRYPLPGLNVFYPTRGNFIGFVGNVRSRTLLKRALRAFRATAKVPSEGAALPSIIPGIGWSDQWAFWQNGYVGIMVTDTAPFRYPHYHRSTDTPDKLDYTRFALVVSGVENVVATLAETRHLSSAQL